MAASEIMDAAREAFAGDARPGVEQKLAAAVTAALRSMAVIVDRGPSMVPMPPSIIATLIREYADDIAAGDDG